MALIRTKGNSSPNLLLAEFSGMVGGLVIKKYKDKIVLSRPPKKRKKKKTTALQKEQQQKMKEAVQLGRRINKNPAEKAKWKKRAKGYSNVYQAVVGLYMKHGNDVFSMVSGKSARRS